ncbi:5'-methylthioadenosine phosphorylase [Angomonas deanei]|nr:5'-methylthioadenosine phosphorylase [Angomonas deanei]|eukprot:EPY38102.1 5'-methylthioadenosine phosphorylase [Angomonas deanei]
MGKVDVGDTTFLKKSATSRESFVHHLRDEREVPRRVVRIQATHGVNRQHHTHAQNFQGTNIRTIIHFRRVQRMRATMTWQKSARKGLGRVVGMGNIGDTDRVTGIPEWRGNCIILSRFVFGEELKIVDATAANDSVEHWRGVRTDVGHENNNNNNALIIIMGTKENEKKRKG